MMRRLFLFFICLVAMVALVSGCANKSYSSEADYMSRRAQELDADPVRKGDWATFADGSRWKVWRLRAVTHENHAGEDVLVGTSYVDHVAAEQDGKVKVIESVPFDKDADADDWVKTHVEKGQAPKLTLEAYHNSRKAELNAAAGEWLGNTEDGFKYGWQLPDGSFVLDNVSMDLHGGVEFDAKDSKPFPTHDELVAGAGPISTNVLDYITRRQSELGNAQIDWGEKHRTWQIYAFRLPDGRYHMDVVQSEPDTMGGFLMAQQRDFGTLNESVAWVSAQVQDIRSFWGVATQYSRAGWALIGFVAVVCFFILFNIARARKGKAASIRRIAGLDQIDEAVGRATEIARPVLMVPGLGSLNGITVQAITIFAYIIRTAARFGTPIRLLNADAAVYAVAQEITRDVYMSEGVPEQYDPTSVRFVSDRQFAFAAGVAGTIQRERVAATFFMGDFFAESMIFAENANMVGAIQVAATTQFTQTPFFIAACDYVLLGDEFYAASAYLGRQPVLVGSLIGVDWAKLTVMAMVFVAVVVHTVQMTRPFAVDTLPPETRAVWLKNNQTYLDWRKTDLFFNRLTKMKRS